MALLPAGEKAVEMYFRILLAIDEEVVTRHVQPTSQVRNFSFPKYIDRAMKYFIGFQSCFILSTLILIIILILSPTLSIIYLHLTMTKKVLQARQD